MTTRKYIALFFAASTALTALAGTPLMSKAQAVPVSPMTSDVLVAQTNPLDILSGQLQQSSQRIEAFALDLARQNSPSNLRWNRAVSELDVREGVLQVNLYGRAPAIIGSRRVRLNIKFRIGNDLGFDYDSYSLHVSRCGRFRPACRRARRRASRQIAAALEANRTSIESAIDQEVQNLLAPFVNPRRF